MRVTRTIVFLLAMALAVSSCTADGGTTVTSSPSATTSTATPALGTQASVVRIIDGDTMDMRVSGQAQAVRVRLILVDTPETVDPSRPVGCFGPEASRFAAALMPAGAIVFLEKDVSERDRFGRLLRYVHLSDGRMVNELLVQEGYAQVSTFPPDVKYVDRFLAAQRQAREEGKGLWGQCSATVPVPSVTGAAPATASQTPITTPAGQSRGNCDAAYPTVCIAPYPPDLDCDEVPYRNFRVLPPDPHGFDRDRDGVGC